MSSLACVGQNDPEGLRSALWLLKRANTRVMQKLQPPVYFFYKVRAAFPQENLCQVVSHLIAVHTVSINPPVCWCQQRGTLSSHRAHATKIPLHLYFATSNYHQSLELRWNKSESKSKGRTPYVLPPLLLSWPSCLASTNTPWAAALEWRLDGEGAAQPKACSAGPKC